MGKHTGCCQGTWSCPVFLHEGVVALLGGDLLEITGMFDTYYEKIPNWIHFQFGSQLCKKMCIHIYTYIIDVYLYSYFIFYILYSYLYVPWFPTPWIVLQHAEHHFPSPKVFLKPRCRNLPFINGLNPLQSVEKFRGGKQMAVGSGRQCENIRHFWKGIWKDSTY